MARPPKGPSPRYARKKPSARKNNPFFTLFLRVALLVLAAGLGIFFLYLGYLDFNVRSQFEGKRWSIPARVYANPVDLYAGSPITQSKLLELLKLLHYRQDKKLSVEGTYYITGSQINTRTREFAFWDEVQASQMMQISFNVSGIETMVDLSKGQAIDIMRLDPVQIGSFYPSLKEDRVLVKVEEAPDTLIKGLLATEDRDFYQHFGISLRGIARAIWVNVQAGGMVQGGSTITQQLVKNFYLSSERSLSRKLKEALMAVILEYHYTKQEILEAYLNEIYLGQNGPNAVHGFGLASEFYFGTPLKDLPLEQQATLVALVRGPSEYDPRRYPERSLQRRNLVLDEMVNEGHLSQVLAAKAKAKALNVIPKPQRQANRYPGFLDLVKRRLKEEYQEDDFSSEGLRIFTTLDTQVQDTLEDLVSNKLLELEKTATAKRLETAVVVTRRDSGEVAALISGRDNTIKGFNRALDAIRPIGSLIKPVVYLTALQYPKKYTITQRVLDAAITVPGQNGVNWTPKNYDHKEHGWVPLHKALAKSYNLATVRIGMDIGIARTAKTLSDMGVSRKVDLYPSLFLGAISLSPFEVTQMYQTLAGDGFLTPIKAIRAVVAANGERLQSYPFTVRQVVDPGAAFIVNTLLQGVMSEGTGASAYSVFPKDYGLAGKTGTTNDAKDSWFAGFTGDYLSVVWIGRDDNKPIGLTGATGALPVWTKLMRAISNQPVFLNPPDNIHLAWVDSSNGLLARKGCANARQYPYLTGSEPSTYSACGNAPAAEGKTWYEEFFSQ